jgi:hypothetical protein
MKNSTGIFFFFWEAEERNLTLLDTPSLHPCMGKALSKLKHKTIKQRQK